MQNEKAKINIKNKRHGTNNPQEEEEAKLEQEQNIHILYSHH